MSSLKNETGRNYKDTVFRTLFSEPKRAIELCNAVAGAKFNEDASVALYNNDAGSLLARYNDVAFSIDGQLIVMCEHQSTINPNMPLRFLPYVSNMILTELPSSDSVYRSVTAKFPKPLFYVLYNGKEKLKQRILRLSNAFEVSPKNDDPTIELIVQVIDVNYRAGAPVLGASPSLKGYAYLISEIEKRLESSAKRDAAIKGAIEHCIENGVLAEFLQSNYKEVIAMLSYQYDAEAEARVIRQEGRQEGGTTRALDIAKNLLAVGSMSREDIAKITGLTLKEVDELVTVH